MITVLQQGRLPELRPHLHHDVGDHLDHHLGLCELGEVHRIEEFHREHQLLQCLCFLSELTFSETYSPLERVRYSDSLG